MTELNIGTKKYTKIIVDDEKGAGNANHQYRVIKADADPEKMLQGDFLAGITFQNGAIKENGVNGCQNEDLINIVIHRLQGFQNGDFACRENEMALIKLEEAILCLNKRTNDRIARGVEGRSMK